MNNRLRRVWGEGGAAVNSWLAIPSTLTAEIVAHQGFDSATVDLQHGLSDYAMALGMLQAIGGTDATPMARVPWLEPGIIMKLLDAGALGIVCPMINTREQAEAFVRYTHYAPEGERSVGPTRAQVVHGADYIRRANENVITLAMIETSQALVNVDEIARTPGLTGLYVGPSDLALSMGHEPKLDPEEPEVVAAVERILAAAKEAGIRAGMHCLSPAYARRMIDLGFDLVTLGTDVRLFTAAFADAMRALHDSGPTRGA